MEVREAAVAVVPEEVDAGVAQVRAPPVAASAAKRFAMPSPAELAKVEELARLVKDKRFKGAAGISDRFIRLPLSAVGMSYAAMLSTQASCGHNDQTGAQPRFRTITVPSHRAQAKGFCAKHIDVALLEY